VERRAQTAEDPAEEPRLSGQASGTEHSPMSEKRTDWEPDPG